MSRVGIYTGGTPKKLYGGITKNESLGGSETTAVHLAEELAKDNIVSLFTNTHNHEYNGVTFIDYREFPTYGDSLDTVILTGGCGAYAPILNHLEDTFDNVPNIIMWLHGGGTGGLYNPPSSIYDIVDTVIYQSEWQRYSYYSETQRLSGIDMGIYGCNELILRGFIPDEYAMRKPRESRGPYVVYASVPDRGLCAFTRILPKLLHTYPELEVRSYSSSTIHGWDATDQERDIIDSLRIYSNFTPYNPVPFTKVMDIIGNAIAVAFPSQCEETMCGIAAMAMRTGTPMIASRHSAFPETTMGSQYLVDTGNAGGRVLREYVNTDAYANDFISTLGELYDDHGKWEAESRRCYESSTEFNISSCARQLAEYI